MFAQGSHAHTERHYYLDYDSDVTPTADEPGSPWLFQQIVEAEARLKADRNAPKSKYVNLDFVLGSAAEVECLWSMAKYVLSNQRKSMSPLLYCC